MNNGEEPNQQPDPAPNPPPPPPASSTLRVSIPPGSPAGLRRPRSIPTSIGFPSSTLTPLDDVPPGSPTQPVADRPAPRKRQDMSPDTNDILERENRIRRLKQLWDTEIQELNAIKNTTKERRSISPIDLCDNRGQEPGGPAGGSGARAGKGKRRDSHSSSSGKSDDTMVPGHLATGIFLPIPEAIIKIMRGGWESHISLACLTDDYCNRKGGRNRSANVITIDDSSKHLKTVATDAVDSSRAEDDLLFPEWSQAWRRLLELIQSYQPKYHDRWFKHYNLISGQSTLHRDFKLWIRYDIAVRRQSRSNKKLDVTIKQQHILDDLMPQFQADRAKALLAAELSHNPSPSGSRRIPPTEPNQSRSQNTQKGRQTGNASGSCFRCGRSGHHPQKCTEAKQRSGRPILIEATDSGRWTLNGERFCYQHNGFNGPCTRPNCDRGAHLCSLCGDSGHCAQACPK